MNMKPSPKPANSNQSSPAAKFTLQRKCACGNHTNAGGECTTCAAKKMQKKLSIGAANDPLEMEADRVASEVMANEPTHAFSNISAPKIQRRANEPSTQDEEVPASVENVLASSGSPLPHHIREDMEQRFNQDFSQVRIHTSGNAAQSAHDVQANAYTVGNNIVFGRGQFSPESQQGRHLLAHELTHVVQQQGSAPTTIRRWSWSWGGAGIGAALGLLGFAAGPIGGLIGVLGGGLLGGLLGDFLKKKPPVCNQGVREVKIDFVRLHGSSLSISSLLSAANEIFSECCIKLVADKKPPQESEGTTTTWLKGNTDLDATGDSCSTVTDETRNMITAATKAHSLSGNIQVYLVKGFSGNGKANTQGYSCPPDPAAEFPRTVVMQNGASGSIFAHEIGHILTYGFDYSKESKSDFNYKELQSKTDTAHSHIDNNLMYEAPSPDSPKLTPEQCAMAFANAGK